MGCLPLLRAAVLAALGLCLAASAQELRVSAFDHTGRLAFAGLSSATVYRVEWSASAAGGWTNDGSWGAAVAPGSGTGRVSVAAAPRDLPRRFYRVVATVTNGPASTVPAGMALIPAGEFAMGNALAPAEGSAIELPVHTVYVSAFFMDRREVTKAFWDDVQAWATNHGYAFTAPGLGKATNHPVHSVSWFDCVKWCNARSERAELTPCYTFGGEVLRTGTNAPACNWAAAGYRLPTEAEWEKAARGGLAGQRFPWGAAIAHDQANYLSTTNDTFDASSTHGYHPAYAKGAPPYTCPVGVFAANGFGLYDMAGNVWEWCWNRYAFNDYATSAAHDPTGAASGTCRVLRGGSWYVSGWQCRAANRLSYKTPDTHFYSIGFRCVRR